MSCATPPTGDGFLAVTLAHLDCQAQTIGEAGYQALASIASPISLALTALLSIFVAIIGIRLLMGKQIGASDLVGAALKVGFVLALAASWPAYKTVVYDVVLKGPAEVSASIGRASALPGSDGRLASRLQGIDNGITTLVGTGSGRFDIYSRRPQETFTPVWADWTSLSWGKTLFVTSMISSFGLLRLAGGLFLALAPLFAGFLLFEATRSFFFGWLRSLIAIALSSIGIAIVVGVELAIIEPWLSQVLALRAARVATLSAPFELLALVLAFSLAMLGVFAMALRISFASSVVAKVEAVFERTAQQLQIDRPTTQPAFSLEIESQGEHSRAQIIAQSVSQTLRREAGLPAQRSDGIEPTREPIAIRRTSRQEVNAQVPLGRTYNNTSRRIGAQALKRRPAT